MATQPLPAPAPALKARNSKRMALMFAGFGLLGAAIGYGSGTLMKAKGLYAPIPWWALLAFPVVILMTMALHEAGHVAAGLASGFEFHLFVVGPLRIERVGGKLQFRLNRALALWGGIAACVPQSFGPELHTALVRYTFGGPLFSLLGGLLLIPGVSMVAAYPATSQLLILFGGMSALLALVTLAPMKFDGFVSDGGRLSMLLRNTQEGHEWTALAAISGLGRIARPRNWPRDLVESMGNGSGKTVDGMFACLLRHAYLVDQREFDAAGEWLDRGLEIAESLSPAMRGGIYLAAGSFFARYRGDAAAARVYLDKSAEQKLISPKDTASVKAAVLIAEGRGVDALNELDRAERELAGKPQSIQQAMQEDIEELRGTLRERMGVAR